MPNAPANLDALPIFPLGTVLYPDGLLPLRLFETRYIDMARRALKSGEPFGVCAIHEGREVGKPAVPEPIGTLASIVDCDMEQLGVLKIRTRGSHRFEILERSATVQGLVIAQVELLPDEEDQPLDQRFRPLAQLLRGIIDEQSQPMFLEPYRLDSSSWVGYRIAEILPISLGAKQKLLELESAPARLDILFQFLEQRGLLAGK